LVDKLTSFCPIGGTPIYALKFLQEERWRGGERKGSAWVSRDDVIEEDEEDESEDGNSDNDNNNDSSSNTAHLDHRRHHPSAVDEINPTDRLQVWRCRRQGRLERNFELDNFLPPLSLHHNDGGGDSSEGISIAVPCATEGGVVEPNALCSGRQ